MFVTVYRLDSLGSISSVIVTHESKRAQDLLLFITEYVNVLRKKCKITIIIIIILILRIICY